MHIIHFACLGTLFLLVGFNRSLEKLTDTDNDAWILKNMFGMIDDLYLSNYSWFSTESPCQNWAFVTCNNNSRVIGLDGFQQIGNKNQTINTTFWPPKLLNLSFYSANFGGALTLSNLPNTIQNISILNCLNLVFDQNYHSNYNYNYDHNNSQNMYNMNTSSLMVFPDLSHLTQLIFFSLNNFNLNGTIINLGEKIPNNLEQFYLITGKTFERSWYLERFPIFNNVSQLTRVTIKCEIINKASFVDILLPPKLEYLDARTNRLSGILDFRQIRRNSPNLNEILLNTNDFTDVNFFGLDDDTIVSLSKENSCDKNAYFANKRQVDNPDNWTVNALAICEERISYRCKGVEDCFDTCVCFKIPQDWQPALNDFYTITASLVLLFVVITSIAFSPSIKWYQFLYLKILSVQLGLLLLHWVISTLILGDDDFKFIMSDEKIVWIGTYFVLIFWLFLTFPATIMTWVCNDYSNYYFLRKFNFVTKVLIDKKYNHLLGYNSNNLNGARYFLSGTAISKKKSSNNCNDNNYQLQYWKITSNNNLFLKLIGNRGYDISISQIAICGMLYLIYFWRVLNWVVSTDLFGDSIGGMAPHLARIPSYDLVLLVILMVILCLYGGITSDFARYQIIMIGFIVAPLFFLIMQFRTTWFAFLFRTNLYSGVIDELNIGKQAPVLKFAKALETVLSMWGLCIFCLVSLILYIKMSSKITMKNHFIYQINLTISSVFSGLLDYLTDVLLILYWINSNLYVYAFMELFFVIVGQIATSYLIRDVPFYCRYNKTTNVISPHNKKNKNKENSHKTNINYCWKSTMNILKHVCFLLGFRVIYQSIKPWDNQVVQYEYKWCKLWELMFESMPSVMLSTYVTLMQSTNNNNNETDISVSVIVSMIFSFINLTNTIVAVLNDDQIQPNTVNPNLSVMPFAETELAVVLSMSQSPKGAPVSPTSDESKINADKEDWDSDFDHKDDSSTMYRYSMSRSPRSEPRVVQAPHTTPKHYDISGDNTNDNDNTPANDLNLPDTLWITDKHTGEVSFFAEKKKVHGNTRKLSNLQRCTKYYDQFCRFLLHFDVKIANFVIWVFLTTDLFLKTLSVLSIIVLINYLFVTESNNETINWDFEQVATTNYTNNDNMIEYNEEYFITQSLFGTIINLLYLVFLVLLEYIMFNFMLDQSSRATEFENSNSQLQRGDSNINPIRKDILHKYFCVGLFSNSFYFLLTIGVKYVPKIVNYQSFLKIQHCRIGICCVIIVIQIILNLLFYFVGNFNVWVFSLAFYCGFLFLLMVHCMSLLYLKKYVLTVF